MTDEERMALVEEYFPLIAQALEVYIARRGPQSVARRADLQSAGHLGLMLAARQYDASRTQHGFAPWARRHIYQEMDRLWKYDPAVQRARGSPPTRVYEHVEFTPGMCPVPPRVDVENEGLAEVLGQALAELPPRTQAMLRAYFGWGERAWTYQELGEAFGGLTRQRVHQIIQAGLARIRNGPHAQLLRDYLSS